MKDLVKFLNAQAPDYLTPLEMAKELKEDPNYFINMEFILNVLETGEIKRSDWGDKVILNGSNAWHGFWNHFVMWQLGKYSSRFDENETNPFGEHSTLQRQDRLTLCVILERMIELDQKKDKTFMECLATPFSGALLFDPNTVKDLDHVNPVMNLVFTVLEKEAGGNLNFVTTMKCIKWLFSCQYLYDWDFISFDVDDNMNCIVNMKKELIDTFMPREFLDMMKSMVTVSYYDDECIMRRHPIKGDLQIIFKPEFMKKYPCGAKSLGEAEDKIIPGTNLYYASKVNTILDMARAGKTAYSICELNRANLGMACWMLKHMTDNYAMDEEEFNSIVESISEFFMVSPDDSAFSNLRNNLMVKSQYDDDWIYKRDMILLIM